MRRIRESERRGAARKAVSPAAYHLHVREHPDIASQDVRIVLSHLGNPQRVLDIGCGAGIFLQACHGQIEAVGIDRSPAAVNRCRERELCACLGDGSRLPFRAASFDVVRAKEIIEHLPDPLSLVQECHRVLRDGGLFVVHVPSHLSIFYPIANFYDDYTHFRPFTRTGLRRLLEDGGFGVISIRGQVSGRNPAERVAAAILARFLPKRWLALARRLDSLAP